jgi:hypothetical protein
LKIFVLPDAQVKPNTPIDHLEWAGRWCVEKRPEYIVCLGDFADMESLSSYDRGKKSFEGRRYVNDVDAAKKGMSAFLNPIKEEQEKLIRQKLKKWNPEMIMLLGNHCHRINRAIEDDPKLDGLIGYKDLGYEESGWKVIPFLQVYTISNIAFSHYFVSGVMGRPVSSARMLLTKHHTSCVAGHQQGRDIAFGQKSDGTSMTAIISGSYYQHDEAYLTAQNNIHWRGCWQLNDVQADGSFDELPLSISYLRRKYGTEST